MDISDEVIKNGFSIIPDFLNDNEITELTTEVQRSQLEQPDGHYAIRNVLQKIPAVKKCLITERTQVLLRALLGPRFFAVRGLFFNKVPEANWRVAWHQDLTISVKEKLETPGFGPWSVKEGVHHVQAPDSILGRMLAVRIHLDDSGMNNGPLRVIPGSHLVGRLKAKEVEEWVGSKEPVACVVPRGGLLLMRPLLLHASSSALKPDNRRVIHVELASEDLIGGLEWFEKVPKQTCSSRSLSL